MLKVIPQDARGLMKNDYNCTVADAAKVGNTILRSASFHAPHLSV